MIAPRYMPRPKWAATALLAAAGLDPRAARERIVEIGPGRGDFLLHLAKQSPEALVCGIEIKYQRFLKLLAHRCRQGIDNLMLACGDGRSLVSTVFAEPIDQIYIQFPDPWPKRRHQHHRLMDREFVRQCAERLRIGGGLWFITDHRPYAEMVQTILTADRQWHSVYAPAIVTESPEAYPTYFAEKWRKEGRTIYYQRYIRRTAGPPRQDLPSAYDFANGP